jgi:undecaprenyl-diphosphatase
LARRTSHKVRSLLALVRARRYEVGLIIAFAIGAGLILAFGLFADEVLEGDIAGFDRAAFAALRTRGDLGTPIGPPWLKDFARDVTSLGSIGFLGFIAAATIGYLLLIRQRALALLMAVAVIGGMLVSTLLKLGFDRPRPDLPHLVEVYTASFPSGHATLSAITYLTLAALLARVHDRRRVQVYFITLAILLTIAVGVSRVYLGVHYASDVLAGWCVGSGWAILCWASALWLQRARGR